MTICLSLIKAGGFMKKLISIAVAASALSLVGCNTTMDVTYTPITELETHTSWEINPVTGSWEPVESTVYIHAKEKQHTLPKQYDRFANN